MGVKLPIKKEVAQWYAQMKKYATCCSFVAQLNCNKTEKQWILNRSYFKIHLFGQDFPPPKKVQPTFLPSCDIQKKKTELHHDSIHPESSLKQTLQQDLSIIFIDFRKTKPYIYIYPYPFEVTWILHGLINDVIYIAPGANRCPKALFDLGCMDAIGISDQAHGLRIAWPRMGIRWFFLSQLGHGRPAWIS